MPLIDDFLYEGNETINLALSAGVNCSITPPESTIITITEDDPIPTVEFTLSSSSGDEGVTPTNIELSLSAASGLDVTVNYAVTGGTATGGGVDYTLVAGTATIPAGNTTANIIVAIINDLIDEADETIEVNISNPTNANLGGITSHTFTILDNDYTITATAGSGGTISPLGDVIVEHGTDQTFTITPDEGYRVNRLIVDSMMMPPSTTYTFTDVTRNHTIEAIFAINTYTISGNAGVEGVTITFSNEGGEAISGTGGSYTHTVNHGWTGTATPTKTGYTFEPTHIDYSTPVTSDIPNQNYTATSIVGPPDLIVDSMTHLQGPSEEPSTFTAEVKNIGNSTAGASTLMFKIGGETPGAPETLFSVPALGPGETYTVTRTMLLVPGTYINTATADCYNNVIETDETNNTRTDEYIITDPLPNYSISKNFYYSTMPLDDLTLELMQHDVGEIY